MAVAPEDELASIVGPDHIRSPGEPKEFALDGSQPSAIVSPGSYEEVAAVLGHANSNGLSLIPWGGGTTIRTGNAFKGYDLALDLSRLNAIVEHEPADLTVCCQAGIRVADLQAQLDSSRQRVAFDRYLPPQSTVGGALGSNLSGASQSSLGSPRDFTLGLGIVTVEGRLIRAGGKVVKNVAGYDLGKLFVGSRGTLGIVVEAVFKLQPTPEVVTEIGLRLNSVAEGCNLAIEAHRRALNLRSVVVINSREADGYYPKDTPPAVIHLELAGTPKAVERSQAELSDLANISSMASIESHVEIFASLTTPYFSGLTCTGSVKPTYLPALFGEIETAVPDVGLIAQPITGKFRIVSPSTESAIADLGRLRGLIQAAHGTLVVENTYNRELKRQIDVFGDPPPSFPLMRRIKQQFDPNGILSPGRFVGRL